MNCLKTLNVTKQTVSVPIWLNSSANIWQRCMTQQNKFVIASHFSSTKRIFELCVKWCKGQLVEGRMKTDRPEVYLPVFKRPLQTPFGPWIVPEDALHKLLHVNRGQLEAAQRRTIQVKKDLLQNVFIAVAILPQEFQYMWCFHA